MNWIIGKLIGGAVTATTPLRMVLLAKVLVYVLAALVAAIALFGGLYYVRGLRIDALNATVESQKQAIAAAADANEGAMATVRRLAAELQRREVENQNIDTAVAEIEAVRRQWILNTGAELRQLKAELEAIYAGNSECAALRRVPVCGPLTDRLLGKDADPP